MSNYAYTGTILDVDLSQARMFELPTEGYAERFIGGRGLASRLYWERVPPQAGAFDPENCLVFATGPLTGFTRLGSSRWQICGKASAMEPQFFSHANLGGSWGVFLKFAGYDAVAVHGCAEQPAYLYLHDGTAEIRDASSIWGKDAIETQQALKGELGKDVRVATTGQAGEKLVSFATVLADDDSSGSSGFGSVMGSKKLKAIAVAGSRKPEAADREKLRELGERLLRMRQKKSGTSIWTHEPYTRRYACYGCGIGCDRQYYDLGQGNRVKYFCQVADMYEEAARKYYGSWNEVIAHAAALCNRYCLDSFVLDAMISWLARCYTEGILSEEQTGLPFSRMGSPEFIEILLRKISYREGFGDLLAQGTLKAAAQLGRNAEELIGDSISTRANDLAMYDPRLYITNGLLYAMEPRKPIQQLHELATFVHSWDVIAPMKHPGLITAKDIRAIAEKFWGSPEAGDMSTYEGKALAAKKIQDRNYAKESLILCDFLFPLIWVNDHPSQVGVTDMESQIFTAASGIQTDEAALERMGERVFNMQRAIRIKEGWGGRKGDVLMDAFYEQPKIDERFNPECLVPGKDGEPYSRKGGVVERDRFEQLKGEYYALRAWDVESGLQTMAGMRELGLTDVAAELKHRGLLGGDRVKPVD